MEEVIPLFISFVDSGANQYGLEIMDYDVYINKNDKTGEKMTEKEEKKEEAMIPISALDKLRDFFSINKSESNAEEVKTEETVKEDEKTDDISNKELLEKLPAALAETVKEAITEAIENAKEDVSIDKEDKNEDDKNEDTSEDEKDEEKPEENPEKNEKEKEDVEINKRQTSMTDVVVNDTPSPDFYTRTNRDHLGRKIRN